MDLERSIGGVINVAWTQPGEWITYTVQHAGNETVVQDVAVRYAVVGGSNGITLALDLDDPSECSDLAQGDEKVRCSRRGHTQLQRCDCNERLTSTIKVFELPELSTKHLFRGCLCIGLALVHLVLTEFYFYQCSYNCGFSSRHRIYLQDFGGRKSALFFLFAVLVAVLKRI